MKKRLFEPEDIGATFYVQYAFSDSENAWHIYGGFSKDSRIKADDLYEELIKTANSVCKSYALYNTTCRILRVRGEVEEVIMSCVIPGMK